VRFPSSNYKLLATGKGGAVLDRGDGELIIPAIVQPILEYQAPLAAVAGPSSGDVLSSSFLFNLEQDVGPIAVTANMPNMSAGLWQCRCVINYTLTTLDGAVTFPVFGLRDPSGTLFSLYRPPWFPFARAEVFTLDLRFHFIADGWNFSITTPASAVAAARLAAYVVHNKLLP